MVMFIAGLTVGIFVGVCFTIVTFALCSAAKGDDEE